VKRVLVTGASGFIGRHCLPPLLDDGFEVHAIARQPLNLRTAIKWHQIDLLAEGAAAAIARRVAATHLLHLAWCASPVDYLTNASNRRWASVTLELAEAFMTARGERFVGAGSCAEYGTSPIPCAEETTPLHPTSLYGECKVTAFRRLDALANAANFSFAWGRTFFPYGPYQARARLIPSIVMTLLEQRPMPRPAGHQIRDFIHVQDVAGAFVALLDSEVTGACNIGSGVGVKVSDLVTLVARLMGGEDSLHLAAASPDRAGESAFIVADTRRLRDELGWRPRLSLENGLNGTVEWWRSSFPG
jgi:nucleoside-diphosphate-sugar epimerase